MKPLRCFAHFMPPCYLLSSRADKSNGKEIWLFQYHHHHFVHHNVNLHCIACLAHRSRPHCYNKQCWEVFGSKKNVEKSSNFGFKRHKRDVFQTKLIELNLLSCRYKIAPPFSGFINKIIVCVDKVLVLSKWNDLALSLALSHNLQILHLMNQLLIKGIVYITHN